MKPLSKRAQVEALGWTFKPIPRIWAEGRLSHNSSTGWKSPAFHDYKHPEAWIVTPPVGHAAPVRRFDNASPNLAVRWAYDQAMAPEVKTGGVAALAALMATASNSRVIAECSDAAEPVTVRPDAELLNLCREAIGCDRIADDAREGGVDLIDRQATKGVLGRLSEACRAKERLIPRIIELEATTPAAIAAKAAVIGSLFATSSGRRKEAVESLVRDVQAMCMWQAIAPTLDGKGRA